MTLETLLDAVQSTLHDDGTIWTRSELLRWANDGYRDLASTSHSIVRPYQLDVPGRSTWSLAFEWEDRHASGTVWVFTNTIRSSATLASTHRWITEVVDSLTPTDSLDVVTQLWEQLYSGQIDRHFRFFLPRSNERPLKVYWDNKRLAHTSVRERDTQGTDWWQDGAEPLAWMTGVGRERTFEIFEIQTDYNQSYDLRDADRGVPRLFQSDVSREYEVQSRSRTWDYGYTGSADAGQVAGFGMRITVASSDLVADGFGTHSWESDTTATATADDAQSTTYPWEGDVQLGLGLSRRIVSTDRQYLATAYDSGLTFLGSPRRFGSSDNALTVWQTIVPTRQLTEEDTPDLIPTQCAKYIKFYVLSKAFARAGQGHRPDLAEHFTALFRLGVSLLTMLGTPSVLDRVYAREQVNDASVQAPPRVRFPSTFQRWP